MRALFTLTVFCSAFFLFIVEPIAGKMLLPMFGGSASVWTAAMVFFQVSLLAGYAYANWMARQPMKRLPLIHLGALIVVTLVIDITLEMVKVRVDAPTKPSVLQVVWTLSLFVGPPFVLLSATAPLLQRAFAHSKDAMRHSPYFLYAASNAGSLVALLAYPVVVEPFVGVSWQFGFWLGASKLVMLAGVLCLVAVAPGRLKRADVSGGVAESEDDPHTELASEPPTSTRQRLKWLALAAAPSSLLLGVTTFLTTSVAPIPLLWVVPLSLYLTTFIIAFAHRPRVSATAVGRWIPAIATPLALALILESATPIIPLALLHLGVAFVAMLSCHLQLSESRPGPGRLTEFYLWLAAGGAIGGLFNALVAPIIFTTLFEYPLALAACCALAVLAKPSGGKRWEPSDWRWPIGVGALATLAIITANLAHMQPSTPRTILTIGLPAVLCFLGSGRTIRYGLSLFVLFAVSAVGRVSAGGRVLYGARSFYGVHRVVEDAPHHLRKLVHGNTVHGIQSTLPSLRREPLTYYSRMGPAGLAFLALQRTMTKPNVGVVGLGVGSLAAYGQAGQSMTFFEIDPVVIRVATNPKLFTFLADSKASIKVILGDGRLTLADQPDHKFGILVLDAFTSDSIPVHLLTREALDLYVRKLAPHGVILFHISNNYLDLAPILSAEARDHNLTARLNDDSITSQAILDSGVEPSKWMAIARNKKDLAPLSRLGAWDAVTPAKRGWTDDFSDILSAFKLDQGD
ncbi:MAG: fused MFS/spermidine synthase [Fimbriimonadaceae bacterium]